MNFTELARKLNINPNELRRVLPMVGFDIGAKAIKIDKRIANRIIQNWRTLFNRYKRIMEEERLLAEEEAIKTEVKEVELPPSITVRDFANRLGLPINRLMEILMKNGIFVSLNEKIDYETAAIIAMDLGIKASKCKENTLLEKGERFARSDHLRELLKKKDSGNIKERPPVVVVMGHVDHGKTKLLDYIRKTNIIDKEAGGITQHIGAYQAEKNNSLITFIDTPGHEAFTAMRSRGAKIADIAILVVAADDGVKPQTVEAIKIIEQAKLPFVVAVNKMDKKEANIDKVKQELSAHNVVVEDWGGKAICIPISAKDGTGVSELLDMLLLAVDLDKEKMKVSYRGEAVGSIIESHIDKGEGPVATVLIQKGILKKGDFININKQFFGKIRLMKNCVDKEITQAAPSAPVRISGFKNLVQVGDVMEAVVEKTQKGKIKKIRMAGVGKDQFAAKDSEGKENGDTQFFNIILKADVLGSTEVISESLEKIEAGDIKIKVINRGLGNVTEADVMQAEAIINNQKDSDETILIGFNVKIPQTVDVFAKEKNINIKIYTIIYDLLNYARDTIKAMTKVKLTRKEIGRVLILEIFRTEKGKSIVGGKVLDGVIKKDAKIEILRDNENIGEGELVGLQSGKQDVFSVEKDSECGVLFQGKTAIEKGDKLVVYQEKEE
ncbi:MAG: translation initiation factor IF-2 [Patescibacteria group bacterium]|nr:translation initiation factor IF-2 [Patescibacteria group bacterium]